MLGPVAIGLGVLGGMGFYMMYSATKNLQNTKNIATSSLRGLALGQVEIAGKAQPQEQTYRPRFSDEECVYYRCLIEGPNENNNLAIVYFETQGTDFYLEDETDKVLVKSAKAQRNISEYKKHVSVHKLPENIQSSIAKTQNRSTPKRGLYSVTEQRIPIGQELYVVGVAKQSSDVTNTLQKDIVISAGENKLEFTITAKGEKGAIRQFRKQQILGAFFGIIFTGVAFMVLYASLYS